MPPQKSQAADYRKFYFAFGLELSPGTQLQGDCPFCLKSDHFFANPKTSQYDCKSCGASGNSWTFLREIHKVSLQATKDADYRQLSEDRGILPATFEHLQLAKSILSGKWMIPVHNLEGKLTNIYHVTRQGGAKFAIISSPSPCTQLLYLGERIKSAKHLWICEGHWDAMLLLETFAHLAHTTQSPTHLKRKGKPNFDNDLLKDNAVVGLPGANNFNKTWVKLLANKHVYLLHDNDADRAICKTCRGSNGYKPHPAGDPCPKCGGMETLGVINPGKQGIERIVKLINSSQHHPSSLQKIGWEDGDPNDIRDLIYV